jgi:protein associated with RNAse G/E
MSRIIKVETFKYPDIVRYFFPAIVVEEQPNYLLTYFPSGTPIWNGKTGVLMRAGDPALSVMFSDRDYNAFVSWDADGRFKYYYVNIAFPAEWDNEWCKYVDLDLDLLWLPHDSKRVLSGENEPGIIELDRDEYEERKVTMGYSPALQERIEAAALQARQDIEAGVFPFDGNMPTWKPLAEYLALSELPDSAAMWHL